MSLDPPTYLSSLKNNIRARPIPWDGAVRAGTITEDQLSKIRAVDKVRKEQRKQTVEDNLKGYRVLFVGAENVQSILESAAKRADVVQYILVLLGDLLEGMQAISLFVLLYLLWRFLTLPKQVYLHSQQLSWTIPIPTNHLFLCLPNPRIPRTPYRYLHLPFYPP